jgi:ABC-type glycerol-3-phosphate transport system permease component
MTAYGFSRFRFPGRDILFIVCLSTLVLPGEVTIIPQYLMFHKVGWLNTLLPLTVPALFGGGAFFIFMMRQYIMTIPQEMDEAAKIDGAGHVRIFFQLLLPLCKPVLATAAIFSFLGNWNDFWGPLIYIRSKLKFTLALGLRNFQAYANMGDVEQTEHLLMAASVTMSIPCIILFFVAQRSFIKGITLSAVKG